MTSLAKTASRPMASPWLLPLLAGNLAVATLAWVIVGALMAAL